MNVERKEEDTRYKDYELYLQQFLQIFLLIFSGAITAPYAFLRDARRMSGGRHSSYDFVCFYCEGIMSILKRIKGTESSNELRGIKSNPFNFSRTLSHLGKQETPIIYLRIAVSNYQLQCILVKKITTMKDRNNQNPGIGE